MEGVGGKQWGFQGTGKRNGTSLERHGPSRVCTRLTILASAIASHKVQGPRLEKEPPYTAKPSRLGNMTSLRASHRPKESEARVAGIVGVVEPDAVS